MRCCWWWRTIRTTRACCSNLARDRGFKVLLARTGADALALARKHRPTAVSLDVFLPDMLGWTVLNQLKRNPETRHIPVQILTIEDERQYGLERGAFSFITKTVTTDGLEEAFERLKSFTDPRVRRLLVVEDDPAEQLSVRELLGHDDVEITAVGTGAEALALMRERAFDCVVLDLRLPDMSGFELLGRGAAGAEAARYADRRVHRPRAVAKRRRSSCARTPRASCSRACARRSGCSMRRRCSCTG